MSLAPGVRLGAYEIVGLLGAGGMGEVYRARDARLGREVAIKVLPAAFADDPDRLRRFEEEARGSLFCVRGEAARERTQNQALGTRHLEPEPRTRTWNPEPGTQNGCDVRL
jgi:serine/threonine protein kinase